MLDKIGLAVKAILSDLKGVKADISALQKMPAPKDGEDGISPDVDALVEKVVARIPTPKDGEDGVSPDIDAVSFKVLSQITKPKDGEPGKDAVAPQMADIVHNVLAKIPKPRDGVSPDVGAIVRTVLDKIPAPKVLAAEKQPAPVVRNGKDGVSITKVKLEKGNKLAVWLDGVRRLVGTIEIPKPVAAFTPAGAGGGGAGGHTKTPPFYKQQVVVRNPAQLTGVLRSDVLYYLDGIVDFTGTGLSIEVPQGGLSFGGHTFEVSGIKCDDDDFTLFTSPVGGSGNLLGKDYFLEVSGAGSKVYDLFDATGNNAFEFQRINYNNCSSLGEISGYRQGLEEGTGRFGGKPELTLSGEWAGGFFIDTSIVRGLDDGAYSLFKAGAGFVMNSRFRSNQNIDLPASASFLDFSPANFVNPSTVQLVGCLISRNGVTDSGDTNIIPNLAPADLVSEWKNNNGIGNTFVGGELNIVTEVATSIVTAGVFVDLAGGYEPNDLQHFDEPANGQLRHLGESPLEYSVGGQLVLDAGGNNEVSLRIAIFRDATSTFEQGKTITRVINNLQGGRDVGYFVLSDNITLNQNDYVKLEVANDTVTDITAELDSFIIISAR